jgi:hypothetical protein
VDFHKQCLEWADFTRILLQGLSIDKQIYLRIKQQKNFKTSNIERWNATLAMDLAENEHDIKKYIEKNGISEKSFIEKVLKRHYEYNKDYIFNLTEELLEKISDWLPEPEYGQLYELLENFNDSIPRFSKQSPRRARLTEHAFNHLILWMSNPNILSPVQENYELYAEEYQRPIANFDIRVADYGDTIKALLEPEQRR